MKRLIFILVFFPLLTQAQWNYTYGNDTTNQEGYSIVYTSDGNYAIGGTTIWEGEKTMYLIKVNEYGEKLWERIYKHEGENWNITKPCLKETNDKGFIFLGNKLIKTNSDGLSDWKVNQNGINIFIDSINDNYIIFNGRKNGEYTTKSFTSNGEFVWEFDDLYYGTDNILLFKDSLIALFGMTETGTSSTGIFCISVTTVISTNGTRFTNNEYQSLGIPNYGSRYDSHSSAISYLSETNDNGIISCGNWSNFEKVVIQRFDSTLKMLWTKTYSLSNYADHLNYIEQTHDNGYIAIGSAVIRLDENGDTLWTRPDINGKEIRQINDSSFVLIRTDIDTITGDKNINIIKLTGEGNIASNFVIPPLPSANGKLINIIDFTGRQTKEKPNLPLIYIYENGTTEKKMIIE